MREGGKEGEKRGEKLSSLSLSHATRLDTIARTQSKNNNNNNHSNKEKRSLLPPRWNMVESSIGK